MSNATILAELCILHNQKDKAFEFLETASDFMITYGYHKDILFHDFMQSVILFAKYKQEEAFEIIKPLISKIMYICDFTDGKETRHVIPDLFEFLSDTKPEILLDIYNYLLNNQEFFYAEDAFKFIIKSFNFKCPIEQAIGKTAVDNDSFNVLKEKAEKGNKNADKVRKSIVELFGESPFALSQEKEDNPPYIFKEEKGPKVSEYPLEKLSNYILELRQMHLYPIEKELRKWVKYWQEATTPKKVIDALVEVTSRNKRIACAELIFELELRCNGYEKAWSWLVKSFKEVYGWSFMARDKELASKKWMIVKNHYPEKWFLFIQETMQKGIYSWDAPGIHGRLQRLTEYLIFTGHEDQVSYLLEGIMKAINDLTNPFFLQHNSYYTIKNLNYDKQKEKLLLQRMLSPSGMVRERTCNTLGELLVKNNKMSFQIADILLQWISEQELEIFHCIGLLPFIRAKQLNPKTKSPDIKIFIKANNRPTLLSQVLLKQLFPDYNNSTLVNNFVASIPHDFQIDDKFFDDIKRMPGIYIARIDTLSQYVGPEIWKRLAYESKLKEENIQCFSDPYHCGRLDDEHFVAYDNQRTDVLMSAFLRTMNWLETQGREFEFIAYFNSLLALPIDLALWNLSPGEPPKWWLLKKKQKNNKIDIDIPPIFSSLETIFKKQEKAKMLPMMISGRILEDKEIYDLEIISFLQRSMGKNMPSQDVIIKELLKYKIISLKNITPEFEGIVQYTPMRSICLVDWEVIPLVGMGLPYSFSKWQRWRMMRGVYLPMPGLFPESYTIKNEHDRLSIHLNNKEVGFWQDWNMGITEKIHSNILPRSGQHVMLNRSIIDQFCQDTGFNYCWACSIKGYKQEHGYGEYKEFTFSKIIGASSIITTI